MEKFDESDNQPNPSVDDDQDDEELDDDDDAGDTGEGDGEATKTVKIGDKEYTPEQIAEMEKKSSGYDALLPEFTQKSQKLAELEKASKPKEEDLPVYMRPGWQPKDYGELAAAIKEAEERGMNRALGTLEERQQAADKIKQDVDGFVADIKKSDKDFDDQDFFSYTVKHKFPVNTVEDLRAVYSSYQELQKVSDLSEDQGRKGREGRRDKVNNPNGGKETGPNFSDLRSQGGSILDVALSAFERLKK